MKTLFAFAFLLCISVGYGLKCYTCTTTKSWDDCATNKKEMTCPSGTDTCYKVHLDGKIGDVSSESYMKLCGVKSVCNDNFCKTVAQQGITVNKCEVNCCDGDLCNGAKVPMVSAFMLLACALVAFFR